MLCGDLEKTEEYIEKIEKELTKYYNEGGTEKEPEPLLPAGAEKERI